jgi:hypothetical protein
VRHRAQSQNRSGIKATNRPQKRLFRTDRASGLGLLWAADATGGYGTTSPVNREIERLPLAIDIAPTTRSIDSCSRIGNAVAS